MISGATTELARFNITLAIASAEKNVLSPATFQAADRDLEVFARDTVVRQLRAMFVPFEVGSHLILNAGQRRWVAGEKRV